MKHLLSPAVLLVALLLTAGCGNRQKSNERVPAPETPETVDMSGYLPALEIGSPAPDFEAPDILGNTVRPGDFRGRYVVLDFWATWCKDCREELPGMIDLYNTYGPKGVQFVGVSFDTDKQTLFDYCLEHEIGWIQLCNGIKWKENPISTAYDLHWIPTLFLIDPQGNIAGITFNAAELGTMLAALDTDA